MDCSTWSPEQTQSGKEVLLGGSRAMGYENNSETVKEKNLRTYKDESVADSV